MLRRRTLFTILAGIGFAAPVGAVLFAGQPSVPRYREGEVLVKYGGPADGRAAIALKSAYGMNARLRLLGGRLELLRLPSVMDVPGALAALRSEPGVEYAEPNFIRYKRAQRIPNDLDFDQQWGLLNSGQPNFVAGGPAGIAGGDLNLTNAWNLTTGTGAVTIAVIDDGVETTHPDLAANIVPGYNFVKSNNDPNPDATDAAALQPESHGTAVAGCVAAVGDNGIGVAGAAWNEKLMPLKFDFSTAQAIAALAYARDHGAKVVNGSFGGPSYTRAERDAIADLAANDILFVVAAGNENANTDLAGAAYPANYQFSSTGAPLDNLVAVVATNRQDGVASFSSYGPVTMPVAAPGLQIVTTTVNGGYTSPSQAGGAAAGLSGTSFAAPYVSGIAALIRDYLPTASAAEVKARLIESGQAGLDPESPVNAQVAGGRIDAQLALSMAPRPAIVIEPVQTGSYQETYSTGPESIPVVSAVAGSDGAIARLTPGQSTDVRISLRNLWMPATAVTATLRADSGVTVSDGPLSYPDLGTGVSATRTFRVSVPAGLASGHHEVQFELDISANSGQYTAHRHFSQEVGVLQDGVAQSQAIQTTLHDSFQTWRYDLGSLPAGAGALHFTTTAANDVDILVRYGAPAQYSIELGADRTASPAPLYFTSPGTEVGGNPGGTESVTITQPQIGSYYVTVVNFDRKTPAIYTLAAVLDRASPASSRGSSGGGAVSPIALLLLVAARRLRCGVQKRKDSRTIATVSNHSSPHLP